MIRVMDEDQLLTHAQAAAGLGVSQSHLYDMRTYARLPTGELLTVLRNERKEVRYLRSEVEALRAQREAWRPDRGAIPA
jgi:predicted DNA-binding transcriptional regulator AlpA